MNPMNKVSQVRISSPILTGLVYAVICMAVGALTLSLILTMTSMEEKNLPAYVNLVHGLSVLIGGYAGGKKTGQKGWYAGGLLGILYCVIIYIVGFLGLDASLSLQTLFVFIGAFLVGALGGILGVNAKK